MSIYWFNSDNYLCSCSSGAASLILDPVLHVQRQITSGRLPSEFNYKGFLAPWLQVQAVALTLKLSICTVDYLRLFPIF